MSNVLVRPFLVIRLICEWKILHVNKSLILGNVMCEDV